MIRTVVHYAIVSRDRGVAPLCGDWTAGTSWTTVPSAVRCPRCAPRLPPRSTASEDGSADAPPRPPAAHA